VSGITIVDSMAAVSLVVEPVVLADGGSIPPPGAAVPPPQTVTVAAYERVYWPAFPRSYVRDALAFEQRLSDPQALREFEARLPTQNKSGTVVIRHSNWLQTPFVIFVSYDVMDGGVIRHFAPDGHEEFLPSQTPALPNVPGFPADGGAFPPPTPFDAGT
jgi:hypothetical protein